MEGSLPIDRLRAIIDLQNEIAASSFDLHTAMSHVARGTQELLGAKATAVEIADGEEMTYRVGSGARKVDTMATLSVPVHRDDRRVGTLTIYRLRPGGFTDADSETLALLSAVITAHMSRASGDDQDLRRDQQTGLPNRRAFDEIVGAEVSRFRRHGGEVALCLAAVDLSREGSSNGAGEAALQEVARKLSRIRGEDTAFRYGDEVFALLLVGATLGDAARVIERLTDEVGRDPACGGAALHWGIATLPGTEPHLLVERAEATLDDAKRAVAG